MADTQAALQETITWHSVHDSMPDCGNVLIKTLFPAVPVWLGFHDSRDGWYYVDGNKVKYAVTHWAELPEGPTE